MTRVSQLMTKKLITVGQLDSVEEAVTLLRQRGVRHLLVMHKARLVGIVSDRDVKRALNPAQTKKRILAVGGLYFLMEPILVEEIMTADPVTVTPSTSAHDAAQLMLEHRFGALPVVRGTAPVGIITETDLLRHYVTRVEQAEAARRSAKKEPGRRQPVKKRPIRKRPAGRG